MIGVCYKEMMALIYVKRNDEEQVVAAGRFSAALEGWELCPGDDPELVVFLAGLATANPLAATDLGLARVVEDLIDLLIDHDVMRFTDLPAAAQEKLLKRRGLRASLGNLHLLGDDEEQGLI
jgi:hypothetical protein